MKKSIGITVCIIMLLQVFNCVCANGAAELVNIAVNKAAFASSYTSGHSPKYMNDGNADTYFESGTSSYTAAAVIDLGKEYETVKINFTSKDGDGAVKIYGSNDGSLKERNLIAEVYENGSYDVSGSFRYIIAEKRGNLKIAELEVYAAETQEIQDNSLMVVSREQKTYFSNNSNVYKDNLKDETYTAPGKNAVDGDYKTAASCSGNGNISLFVDLGAEYAVPYITAASVISTAADYMYKYTSDFYFVGTNDPEFSPENDDILSRQDGSLNDAAHLDSGIHIYETDSQYKEKKYRYVGVRKIKPENDLNRLLLNVFDVYTYTNDVGIKFKSFSAQRDIGDFMVNAEIISGKDSQINMIFSAYDSGNRQIGAFSESKEIKSGEINKIFVGKDLSSVLEDYTKADKIRLDVMTDDGAVVAVSEDVTNGIKIYNAKASEPFEANISKSASKITVSGICSGEYVLAMVYDPDGNLYCVTGVEPKDDSSYSVSFETNENSMAGEYTVKVCSTDSVNLEGKFKHSLEKDVLEEFKGIAEDKVFEAVEKYSDYFETEIKDVDDAKDVIGKYYVMAIKNIKLFKPEAESTDTLLAISAAMRAALLMNAVLNKTDYGEYLDKYTPEFGEIFDENYDRDEFEQIFEAVKKKNKTDTAEDIVKALKRTVALSVIFNGTYADRSRAIETMGDILGISDGLPENVLSADLAKKIGNTISDIEEYAGGMNDYVKAAAEELKPREPKRISGGGGGSGGGSIKMPSTPVSVGNAPVQTEKPQNDALPFLDMNDCEWAKDAVKRLYSENILNGKSEKYFEPNAGITREEAVKILVLVCKITTEEQENPYKDCIKGSWYYPYITAANANGVIKGVSDDYFGVGEYITRQDLAAAIYRVLTRNGISFSEKSIRFSDSEDIADYAVNAAQMLAGADVLKGYDDNSFRPLANVTRAEAAVMLDRAYNLLKSNLKEDSQ